METGKDTKRLTVREILEGYQVSPEGAKHKSEERQIAKMLAPMTGGLSQEAFFASMKIGEAFGQSLNIRCKKQSEKVLSTSYENAVLAMVLALKSSGNEIATLLDVPRGALLEAKMKQDIFSLGGGLMFDVLEEGRNQVRVIGSSEISGQLFDWGKGKRNINRVIEKAEQYLRRL